MIGDSSLCSVFCGRVTFAGGPTMKAEDVAEAEPQELLSKLPELMRSTEHNLHFALAVLARVARHAADVGDVRSRFFYVDVVAT